MNRKMGQLFPTGRVGGLYERGQEIFPVDEVEEVDWETLPDGVRESSYVICMADRIDDIVCLDGVVDGVVENESGWFYLHDGKLDDKNYSYTNADKTLHKYYLDWKLHKDDGFAYFSKCVKRNYIHGVITNNERTGYAALNSWNEQEYFVDGEMTGFLSEKYGNVFVAEGELFSRAPFYGSISLTNWQNSDAYYLKNIGSFTMRNGEIESAQRKLTTGNYYPDAEERFTGYKMPCVKLRLKWLDNI